MKYIGSRTSSKKTKKRIRSCAANVPFMPVSNSRVRVLISRSWARGTNPTTPAPTAGRKTARLSAQWSNAFIPLLLGHEHEDHGQQSRGAEEVRGVLLDPARLRVA